MIIFMDRERCNTDLAICAQCSATLFRKPLDIARPCVVKIIDDGDDEMLNIVLLMEGQTLRFHLTEETIEGLELEGWEFLSDLDPALMQQGAADRWRELADSQALDGLGELNLWQN